VIFYFVFDMGIEPAAPRIRKAGAKRRWKPKVSKYGGRGAAVGFGERAGYLAASETLIPFEGTNIELQ